MCNFRTIRVENNVIYFLPHRCIILHTLLCTIFLRAIILCSHNNINRCIILHTLLCTIFLRAIILISLTILLSLTYTISSHFNSPLNSSLFIAWIVSFNFKFRASNQMYCSLLCMELQSLNIGLLLHLLFLFRQRIYIIHDTSNFPLPVDTRWQTLCTDVRTIASRFDIGCSPLICGTTFTYIVISNTVIFLLQC